MVTRRRLLQLAVLLIVSWLAVALFVDWLRFEQQLNHERSHLVARAKSGAELLALLLSERQDAAGSGPEAQGEPRIDPQWPVNYLHGRLRGAPWFSTRLPLQVAVSRPGEARLLTLNSDDPDVLLPQDSARAHAARLGRLGMSGSVQDAASAPNPLLVAYAPVPGTPLVVMASRPITELRGSYGVSALLAMAGILPLVLVVAFVTRRSTANLRRQLAASQDFGRRVVESAVDAIITVDGAGRILSVNSAGLEMFGYTEREVIGQDIATLMPDRFASLPDASRPPARRPGIAAVAGDRRIVRGLRKDGTVVRLELSVSESTEGKSRVVTGILRDVTERVRAQEELRAHERLLNTLIDALPIPVMMKDREGRYRLVNQALTHHLGIDQASLLGRTLREAMPDRPEDAQRIEAHEQGVLERGEVLDLPAFPLHSADGRLVWQHLVKVPMRDADGEVIGLVGLAEDITARRDAEEALRNSRTRLLQAQRIAQLAYWEWDLDTDALLFSDELYAIVGRAPDALPVDFRAIRMVLHPDDLPAYLEQLRRVKHEGSPVQAEHRIVLPDGAVRYLYQQIEVFLDEGGRPVRALGVMQDVTHRRQMEEALQASQRLLQVVFDTIPFPVTVKDRDSRYVMVNRAWLERYGQPGDTAESVIGRLTTEIDSRPEEDRLEAVSLDRRVVEGREALVTKETQRTLITGERRIYQAYKTGLRDEHGNLIGVVSTDVDVTEARNKEEALQASQRLLRTVLDAIPHLMAIKGHDGRYLMVNRAWQEIYGLAEADVMGRHIREMTQRAPEDRRLAEEADAEVLSGNFEHRIVETARHNADGQRFHVQDIRTPLRNEAGEVIGLVDLAMDITERRRTEDVLRQTMRHVALIQHVAVAANAAATPEEALSVGLRDVCRSEGWLLGHAYLRDPENPAQFFSTGLWHAEDGTDPGPLRDETRRLGLVTGECLPGLAIQERRPVWMEDLRTDARFVRASGLDDARLVTGIAVPVLVGSEVVGVLEFFAERQAASPVLLERLAQVGTQLGRVVERHHAARVLRESEERFRNLIEGSIQGVVILVDFRPAFANQAVADIFGYASPAEMMERWEFERSFPPEQAARLRSNHAARLRGEPAPAFYETEAIRLDGTLIWLETNARRILWQGHPAVQITTHEITERKRAEAALRSSEQRFRQLIEGSSLGIVIHTRGVPQFANEAFARLFGFDTPAEILALGALEPLLEPADVPAVRSEQRRVRDEPARGSGQVQVTGLRRDGTRIQAELFFQTIEWQGQRAMQVTVLDVSDRVRLEGQLRQSQKMEAVGQLAGGVAHDFNNMLQIIRGYAELARTRLNAAPEADYLDKVLQACQGASQVIRQLLALSRREVLQPKAVDLNALVQDLMQMARRLIGEHIELVVNCRELPAMVQVDRAMLEQVLLNLCVNARDAMPDGGTLTIETGVGQVSGDSALRLGGANPDRYAVISVADTGTGIAPEVREHVFEPFFTTKAAGKGTGLGLSTAYGIVQQHRGLMDVESEPGHGAVFRIYLPMEETPSAPSALANPRAIPGGTEMVLVAEDEPGVLDLMVQLLENTGYQVLTARDGDEAVRVFNEHADEIGLVILDVVMPRQSGRAVYEVIQARRPDLPVLFNTGYSAEALDEDFVRAHRFHMIRKPYTPRQLLEAVREALDSPWPPEAPRVGRSAGSKTAGRS